MNKTNKNQAQNSLLNALSFYAISQVVSLQHSVSQSKTPPTTK